LANPDPANVTIAISRILALLFHLGPQRYRFVVTFEFVDNNKSVMKICTAAMMIAFGRQGPSLARGCNGVAKKSYPRFDQFHNSAQLVFSMLGLER